MSTHGPESREETVERIEKIRRQFRFSAVPRDLDIQCLLDELDRERAEHVKDREYQCRSEAQATASRNALAEKAAEQKQNISELLALNRVICDALRSETEAFDYHVQTGGKTKPGYTQEVWKNNRWHVRPVGPDESQP